MSSIKIKLKSLPITYPIYFKKELLPRWLNQHFPKFNLVIITEDKVNKIHGKELKSFLKKTHRNVLLFSFPAGEKFKNLATKQKIEEFLFRHSLGKDTVLLALGGGVVGDLAGFVAATYMRGIPYVQIPTTLLAMVDSSIGGKTAINTKYGKNLIGAFWQPYAVFIDAVFLKTLPYKHFTNGLIEAFKMFLTHDARSVSLLEKITRDSNSKTLLDLIKRALKIKAKIISKDEKENNERLLLNFGHTIGHAIEKITDYKILHGHAVALGISVEAKLSVLLGILSQKHYERIIELLRHLDIDFKLLSKLDITKLIAATHLDKKNRNKQVRYVLIKTIGKAYIKKKQYTFPIEDKMIKKALQELQSLM